MAIDSDQAGYLLTLPNLRDRPHLRAAFEEQAEKALAEWERRKRTKADRRVDSGNAWFKREAYRLLAHFIDGNATAIFRQIVATDRRPPTTVEEALKNPFKLGLLAMFSDDTSLSRNNRLVFGNQMLFAWAHDVPADFLNAFLAISGGAAIVAEKIKARQPEPGFEHRFKPSRLPKP